MVDNRLTGHTTWSVTIGRIYVRSNVMKPNNNIIITTIITEQY